MKIKNKPLFILFSFAYCCRGYCDLLSEYQVTIAELASICNCFFRAAANAVADECQ